MRLLCLGLVLLVAPVNLRAQQPADAYDLVIRNGRIVDGTGSPWYAADVGIRDGRIAAIGDCWGRGGAADGRRGRAGRGAGVHRHARAVRAEHPGRSAPAVEDLPGDHDRDHRRRRLGRRRSTTPSSRRTGGLRPLPGSRPTGARSASISRGWRSRGSGSTSRATSARRRCAGWCWATGTGSRRPRSWTRMKALVREAMEQGAVGLSTSLQYPPAPYAHDRGADRARRRGREATAASTPRTCAREGDARSTRRWTRRSGSGARRTSRSRSGTSRRRASGTGAG